MTSKMPDSNFDANAVTLRFLANNVYQEVMEKKKRKISQQKRITSFIKRGYFPP